MIQLTEEQLVQVFVDWEDDYRVNTESFMTLDEVAKAGVVSLSENRAICFKAYLRQRVDN